MGEINFKVGDVVWCVDPGNKNGVYSITSYHRPCIVEDTTEERLYVRVKNPRRESFSDKCAFWVDKKLFRLVKEKGTIV